MEDRQVSVIPLVSVLLVTYNHEQYIRKTIEGVMMQQTNFPFELVIGEDASIDQTRAICEEYQRLYPEHIILLPSSSNLGLNQNFLRTFKVCRGKYIAYLEGDDWWITIDKLQKQVDILNQESDVVLVHTNCKICNVKTGRYQDHLINFQGDCIREKGQGLEGVIAEFEGHFRPMKTSTVCYCQSAMLEILNGDEFLFSNPEFPTQDFQLFQEMCIRGRFAFIDEDTTVIGFHDSISAPDDEIKRVRFRYGFYKIGIYLIDKYQLPQYAIDKWFRKELFYFFKDAINRQEQSILNQAIFEARKRGYKLPLTQQLKLLYVRCLT